MTGTSEDGFDREDYDHGTDEYVSDCNRLPFSEPIIGSVSMSKREIVCCALISLVVCAILCAGAYGLYRLIAALI
jgi:hypothetical protein